MTTIMPQSEMCRKAVAWIDEERRENPGTALTRLIEQAAQRFNLGPRDCQFLERFFKEQQGSGD